MLEPMRNEKGNMMRQLTFKSMALGAVFAISLAAPAMAQDTFTIPHGNWASDVTGSGTMTVSGQTIPMPPMDVSTTACITPEQAVLSKDQTFGEIDGVDCTGSDFSLEGNTMTMVMVCDVSGMKMTSNGTTTFSEDRKSATSEVTMQGTGANGETFNMSMTSTASHTGACTG